MRILGRLRSWLKIKKRGKDDSLSSSQSSSPRRKRSQSLTESAIPSYASRHAQFFANRSNAHLDLVFDPSTSRTDDTASEITPRDAKSTFGRRELGTLTPKRSAQSVRIIPPSPRHPLANDGPEPSPLFAEKVPSATTAVTPPLVPFTALVHPKSSTTDGTIHSASQQLPQTVADIQASPDSQQSSSAFNQLDPTPDVSPDRLADLRRASGVTGVLKIYDNVGAISSKEFDNDPLRVNQRPNSVAKDDQEVGTPRSPNKRRFTNPERSNSSQRAPLPIGALPGARKGQFGPASTPGLGVGNTTFSSSTTDISLTSSTSASILQSSSERDLATSELSAAARVNLARVHGAKMMSKDLVNLPNATSRTPRAPRPSTADNGPSARKPNPLQKIMPVNALDTEIENHERRSRGASLPSTPTWSPDHPSFPRSSTPARAQFNLSSPTPAQGDSISPVTPSHRAPGLSSPALTPPPPKHRKHPPTRLRRPKTADDAAALSPPPWRSVSSFGTKEHVTNVKDMGGGVSVVRIPATSKVRRPATSAGIVSPRVGEAGSLSRGTAEKAPIQEGQSQMISSPSIPESEASSRTCLTTPGQGQGSVISSTTSLADNTSGTNTKDTIQVLVKRRSIRSRLTIPGEDENAPLRRKQSHGRSSIIRKSISDSAFQPADKDKPESEKKMKRSGSFRKIGTAPHKTSDDQAGGSHRRHRRKMKSPNRARLSFVLATDAERGPSPSPSFLGAPRRVSSLSSLGSAIYDSDDDVEREGNDFSDSRSTFGKYTSGAAGSDEETTTMSRTGSTEDDAGASDPAKPAIDLSAELSEDAKRLMAKIREKKWKKLAGNGLKTAST